MVWRVKGSLYAAARLVKRRRLYIFGAFAWMLTGTLAFASLQWQPQGATPPSRVATVKPPAAYKPVDTSPKVAGASTENPAPPAETTPRKPANTPTQSSFIMSAIMQQPAVAYPTVSTPSIPTYSPLPSSDPVQPAPPEPVTPTGNTPIENAACTVDPLLAMSLSGITALTVSAGGQSGLQTVATSDSSNVVWVPLEPVVWGNGTTASPASPVSMVLSYNPGSLTGSSVTYAVRALDTAAPGSTVQLSWRAEDGLRGVCQTLTIQITVGNSVSST